MNKDFLVVDFEYTTFDKFAGNRKKFFSEIIEAGAIRLDGETLEEKGTFKTFVTPEFCPEHARKTMEFCTISIADMKKAISFQRMVWELDNLYEKGKTWFVTWGECDFPVLDTACNHYNVENPIDENDCIDLAEAYRIFKGYDNTASLMNAAEEENVADGLWHAAFDDAVNTGRILEKMIEKKWSVEEFQVIRSEILRKRQEKKAAKKEKYQKHLSEKYKERFIPIYGGGINKNVRFR